MLGTDFGLGPVGLFQACIGAAVLSHHVDDFALVSAFFLFAISCLNMLLVSSLLSLSSSFSFSFFFKRQYAKEIG